jgi:phosphomannomutase
MTKKLIAFDLDGTLTESKFPADEHMLKLFAELLNKFEVCVISGGKFEQFLKQLLNNINLTPSQLKHLHIMPTCGTRYYIYDLTKRDWHEVYAENFTESEKKEIIAALNKGFDDLKMRADKVYGDCIEDRGSQVTFSVLGQDIVDQLGKEGVRIKYEWDPDDSKKLQLRNYIAPLIPQFEVRVGGVTSIDVTKPGIDKAYGMKKLMKVLKLDKSEILFIGDRLYKGGNDYPIRRTGIDTIAVDSPKHTARAVEDILADS